MKIFNEAKYILLENNLWQENIEIYEINNRLSYLINKNRERK